MYSLWFINVTESIMTPVLGLRVSYIARPHRSGIPILWNTVLYAYARTLKSGETIQYKHTTEYQEYGGNSFENRIPATAAGTHTMANVICR